MTPVLHIVFGDSAAGTLKAAFRDLGIHSYRDKVIAISDILSVGPVWQLHQENGLLNRFEWLHTYFTHEPADDFANWYLDSFHHALHKINVIDDHTRIVLWGGDNAHEQTGVRLALYLLRERDNKIVVANATKAYRERYPQFEPLHVGEISPKKMIEIIHTDSLFQPLADQERVQLEQEWLTLSDSNAVLRIWQENEIKNVSADYWDGRIMEAAKKLHSERGSTDFMKSARLIGDVLGHLDQWVGDQYLEYRLRHLIREGVFLMEGSLEAMRAYSVKLKHPTPLE